MFPSNGFHHFLPRVLRNCSCVRIRGRQRVPSTDERRRNPRHRNETRGKREKGKNVLVLGRLYHSCIIRSTCPSPQKLQMQMQDPAVPIPALVPPICVCVWLDWSLQRLSIFTCDVFLVPTPLHAQASADMAGREHGESAKRPCLPVLYISAFSSG